MPAITAPVLALQGADDTYGSLRNLDQLHTAGTVKRHVYRLRAFTPQRPSAQELGFGRRVFKRFGLG
jgi:hypothetical protein